MTPWRLKLDGLHKPIGYGTLMQTVATILLGLWLANGPVWMRSVPIIWWTGLILVFILFQKRGMAVDTFQAIWGTDRELPPGS